MHSRAALRSHTVSNTDGMKSPASGRRDQAQATEALPGLIAGRPRSALSKAVATSKATAPPPHSHGQQAAYGPAMAQRTPFPHPFILGAKPGHSSPSLENSPADAGRDERICVWVGSNVPRTHLEHPVCGRPKGLNDCHFTDGKNCQDSR